MAKKLFNEMAAIEKKRQTKYQCPPGSVSCGEYLKGEMRAAFMRAEEGRMKMSEVSRLFFDSRTISDIISLIHAIGENAPRPVPCHKRPRKA